jgi:hypothetical protein
MYLVYSLIMQLVGFKESASNVLWFVFCILGIQLLIERHDLGV